MATWRLRISHLYPRSWDEGDRCYLAIEPTADPMAGRYFSAELVPPAFGRCMANDLLRLCDLSEDDWIDLHFRVECDDGRAWQLHGVNGLKVDILPGPESKGGTRVFVGCNFQRLVDYGEVR